MARITVEDCLEHVDSPFLLVDAAVRRARQLLMGSKPLIQKKGDKTTVIALREIAAGLVEQVPLAELDQDAEDVEAVDPEEALTQLFESPDMNVMLDLDQDEEPDKDEAEEAEDELDDFEDEDEEEDEEE